MNRNDKIFIAGHSGLIGTALIKKLKEEGFTNLLTRGHAGLDLTVQGDVAKFFKKEKPDYVFLLAAKVGGIAANDLSPADYIYPNILIEANVINAAREAKVKKLLFMACACVYPRECPQPMKEEYILSGKPEPTNLPHTIAKVAGIVLCQSFNKQYGTDFISCVSSNVFGPGDNFDLNAAHVVPAQIHRIHLAKLKGDPSVTVWGTGKPRRDFIYSEDVADACLFLMEKYSSPDVINIGAGTDIGTGALAELVREVVKYPGKIAYDTSKPDGMPVKLIDNSKLSSLGWKARYSLKEGLERTYAWWLEHSSGRKK